MAPLGATNFTEVLDYRVDWHEFDYCCIGVLSNCTRWQVLNKLELHVSCI